MDQNGFDITTSRFAQTKNRRDFNNRRCLLVKAEGKAKPQPSTTDITTKFAKSTKFESINIPYESFVAFVRFVVR
jgi:hypothetical protein